MKFTEGPVWLPGESKVVFSDIPNSKLMQWSKKDGLSVFRKSEQANGNILDLQGRIISCQHAARNIIRIGKDGKAKVLTEKFEGNRFNSPNDVAVWKDGTLWFTPARCPCGRSNRTRVSTICSGWDRRISDLIIS